MVFFAYLYAYQMWVGPDPKGGVSGNGLDGAVWNVHLGNTFQFDFAAIFPGDWNHVVVQIYNEIQYYAYN
jgi:hypothetical protein